MAPMVRLPASPALTRAIDAGLEASTPMDSNKLPDASPAGGKSCTGFQSPMDSFFNPRMPGMSAFCQSPMDRFFDGPEEPSFFGMPAIAEGPGPCPPMMPAQPAGCVMMPMPAGNAWQGAAIAGMSQPVWMSGVCPTQASGGAPVQMVAVPATPGPVPASGAPATPARQVTTPQAAHAATSPAPATACVPGLLPVPEKHGQVAASKAAAKPASAEAKLPSEHTMRRPPCPTAIYVDLSCIREKKPSANAAAGAKKAPANAAGGRH